MFSGLWRRRRGYEKSDAVSTVDIRVQHPSRMPVHILSHDARLSIENGLLIIDSAEEDASVRVDEISLLAIHTNASVTTPCLRILMQAGVPVVFVSQSGYYQGQTVDLSANISSTRQAQYSRAVSRAETLTLARDLIEAKLNNTARLLKRRKGARCAETRRMGKLAHKVARARNLESLRGYEGAAASLWFGCLAEFITREDDLFIFNGRSRRPPADAVNALLSYLYAVLAGTVATAVLAAGMDPFVGFLHVTRPGRPALALDLMEPLRAAIVDSAIIAAVNNGEFAPGDFSSSSEGAVLLSESGRRKALAVLERRLSVNLSYGGANMPWRAAIHQYASLFASGLRSGNLRITAPVPQ